MRLRILRLLKYKMNLKFWGNKWSKKTYFTQPADTELPLVDQDEIVEMIFDHDKVITW